MKSLLSGLTARRSPLARTAQAVRKEGLTYLNPEKLQRMQDELRHASAPDVPGEFLEFGVALGGSAILIATAARAAGRGFAGYDVFGMIPPPTSEKDDDKSRARYEVIRSGGSKGIGGATYYGYVEDLLTQVTASFARHGVPVDGQGVRLVQGLFDQTWPTQGADRVAFVHIDCDWYDPVKYCLEAVADRLSPGGSIMLDDYHDYGGCRTATDEFLAARAGFERVEGANLVLRKR